METILQMKGITKNFGNTRALYDINFDLNAGEVHALLGENGAGKSTLIKVLGGIYKPDTGEIWVNGNRADIGCVADARREGIGIIHQEIFLVQNLTIAENIFLGRELRNKKGYIDYKSEVEKAQEMLDNLHINLNAEAMVKELAIGQQQLIEIAKAVSFDVKILVLDEPTSSLSDEEVNSLFELMDRLKKKNVGMIYISHRFDELYRVTDRITIMRDGEGVATVETATAKQDELVKLMVGRSMKSFYVKNYREPGEVVLKVSELTKKGYFEDVSFEVHAGEIVGFSGLVGAGRSEIMRTVFGDMRPDCGEVIFKGKKATWKNTRDAIRSGLSMVPEDRKKLGLVLSSSVSYNICLACIKSLTKFEMINRKKVADVVERAVKDFSIKTASVDTLVSSLSGGNQQKVLLSKWIATNPALLILDEPTRGIDVGAKQEIYRIMNELVSRGMAVILISSELPEIVNMSDVVYVVRNGKIVKRFERNSFDQENIMAYATGGIINE